jgi:hypothetical protein
MSTSRETVLASLRPVAERLQLLKRKFVFVGGSIAPFYVTDERITDFRPTKDVDVIVEAITRSRMHQIEEDLRKNGFRNDPDVIHRFVLDGTLVDVLPVQSQEFDMLNRWYPATFETAKPIGPAPGLEIFVPTAPCFLATKLEAFVNRGQGDFLASKDIEDVLSIIDGREEIVGEAEDSPSEIRSFLSDTFGVMMGIQAFRDCIEGNISPAKPREEAMLALVDRLEQIARMGI